MGRSSTWSKGGAQKGWLIITTIMIIMGEKLCLIWNNHLKKEEDLSWDKLALMKYLPFKHFIEHIFKIQMLGW